MQVDALTRRGAAKVMEHLLEKKANVNVFDRVIGV